MDIEKNNFTGNFSLIYGFISFILREFLFIYLKLILISITIFIGQDLNSKSLIILLFLTANAFLRKIDQPFLTRKLNSLDFNAALSLLLIFYSVFLSSSFDDENLRIFVIIFIIFINFQFLLTGLRMVLLVTIYKIKSKKIRSFG